MVPRPRRFAIARATIALSMAVLVIAGALGLVVIAQPPSIIHPSTTTSTQTSTATSTSTATLTMTSTQTSTATSTATTTVTSLSTLTVTQTLPAQCLGSSVSKEYFGTLDVGTSSPAVICVQVYEFDASSPIVLNLASLLKIEGFSPSSGRPILDPAANFSAIASSDSVNLGGPTNANEGTVLAFAITAKPGASGTYWLSVQGLYLTTLEGLHGGVQGSPNGILVAGTGQPDYVPSNVIEMPATVGCPSGFTIQGVSYPICPDLLYYRITGVTNSTL